MSEYQPVSRPIPLWWWCAAIFFGALIGWLTWAIISDNAAKGDRLAAMSARQARSDEAAAADRATAARQRDRLVENQRLLLRRTRAQEIQLAEMVQWLQAHGVDLPDRLFTSGGTPPKG